MRKFLRTLFLRLGYQIKGVKFTPRPFLDNLVVRNLELDDLICRLMLEKGTDLTFLQVGAYDGVSTDPLRKYIQRYCWRGVMLEPQPGPAATLNHLYADNAKVTVLEAALDFKRGKRTLYTIEDKSLPAWVGGMASFDRENITKHEYLIPQIEELIVEREVECLTIDDILSLFNGRPIDLLQIDVEGFDDKVIELFPFERQKPSIVHWETKNLPRERQENALERLIHSGYKVSPSGSEDSMAVLSL